MKILMINSVCGIRSTGRICTDLATALEAEGHEVKIAYGRESEVPEQFQKYAIRIGTELDVVFHAIKARLFDASGFGSKIATKRFVEWVKEYDPDVIHLHNIHGYYVNIEILFDYIKTCGKRIIWTLHDCWAFTGHSAFCDAIECEKWKTRCCKCPNVKEYPKSFLDKSNSNWEKKKRLFSNIPDLTIVTPSEWLKELVKESFLYEYPVQVIHNGINTSNFYPVKNDFREFYGINDSFVLLSIETEWTETEVEKYIKLAKLLGVQYTIVLIGIADDYKRMVPQNILTMELSSSIKEIMHIIEEADLLIELSNGSKRITERFRGLLVEKPVIRFQIGDASIVDDSYRTENDCNEYNIALSSIEKYRIKKKLEEVNLTKNAAEQTINLQIVNMQNKNRQGYWEYKQFLGLLGKRILLGVASVWEDRKGLKDIIKLRSVMTQDAEVIIIGDVDKQRNTIPTSILYYERTNDVDELRNLYGIADYYINPTYEDNFPTTNIEALACGTAVITYNTGGSPESIDESCGRVIKKGDYLDMDSTLVYDYKKCCIRSNLFLDSQMSREYLRLFAN